MRTTIREPLNQIMTLMKSIKRMGTPIKIRLGKKKNLGKEMGRIRIRKRKQPGRTTLIKQRRIKEKIIKILKVQMKEKKVALKKTHKKAIHKKVIRKKEFQVMRAKEK